MSSPLSPQVQEWRKEVEAELMELARQYAHCYFNTGNGTVTHQPLSAFEGRLRDAVRAALSAVPFDQVVPEGWRIQPTQLEGELSIVPPMERKSGQMVQPQGICVAEWSTCPDSRILYALAKTLFAASPQPAQPGEGATEQQYVDGVPQFNYSQPCSVMPGGNHLATQCPRCNNPHHACDRNRGPGEALPAEQPKSEIAYATAQERDDLLSALPRWEPIETAPKDGRTIRLGFMEGGEVTQTADMQWSHIQRNGLFPGAVGMWVCPGGNFTWNPEPAEFGPSHWMPLPKPPEAA